MCRGDEKHLVFFPIMQVDLKAVSPELSVLDSRCKSHKAGLCRHTCCEGFRTHLGSGFARPASLRHRESPPASDTEAPGEQRSYSAARGMQQSHAAFVNDTLKWS